MTGQRASAPALLSGRRRPLLILLGVLSLLAAACSGSDDAGNTETEAAASGAAESEVTASEAAESEVTASEADGGPVLASSTFDGEAVTVDGEPYDLGQLAESDLVLWFWAPW